VRKKVLKDYLSIHFQKACSEVKTNNSKFLNGKNPKECPDFQNLLVHLDAETNLYKLGIESKPSDSMNKQYMVIDDTNPSLDNSTAYSKIILFKHNP